MDRRTLPLSALRAFESAAECLHLGRAGERLGVSHGAVSHQIRALEKQLACKLFYRAHNRLELTPEGVRLYRSVKEGLDTILEGARNVNISEISGPMVIACTQTIAETWATRSICAFYQRYPSVDIRVQEIAPFQQKIPADVDLAICYGRPIAGDRQLVELGMPNLYPLINPQLMRGRAAIVDPNEIAGFTLIHDGAVPWNRWLKAHCDSDVTATSNIHFANTSQALNAAVLGYGVALGNSFEAQDFLRSRQLIRLFDLPIREQATYFLLTANDSAKPARVALFERWLTQDRVNLES